MADCGTYAGYVAHVSAGEPTCPSCRLAATDYMRAYRAKRPAEAAARDKAQAALRDRALGLEWPVEGGPFVGVGVELWLSWSLPGPIYHDPYNRVQQVLRVGP